MNRPYEPMYYVFYHGVDGEHFHKKFFTAGDALEFVSDLKDDAWPVMLTIDQLEYARRKINES